MAAGKFWLKGLVYGAKAQLFNFTLMTEEVSNGEQSKALLPEQLAKLSV